MFLELIIDVKIVFKKVIVYFKSYCFFCIKVKKVFEMYIQDGLLKWDDYEVIEIENDFQCLVI